MWHIEMLRQQATWHAKRHRLLGTRRVGYCCSILRILRCVFQQLLPYLWCERLHECCSCSLCSKACAVHTHKGSLLVQEVRLLLLVMQQGLLLLVLLLQHHQGMQLLQELRGW